MAFSFQDQYFPATHGRAKVTGTNSSRVVDRRSACRDNQTSHQRPESESAQRSGIPNRCSLQLASTPEHAKHHCCRMRSLHVEGFAYGLRVHQSASQAMHLRVASLARVAESSCNSGSSMKAEVPASIHPQHCPHRSASAELVVH